MDTKLIIIFIFSALLGGLIVVIGCIKVLPKDKVIDVKSVAFILVGFIFVTLPVLSTVTIEWGDFKFFINTTNKEVQALQTTLDSLKSANNDLQDDLQDLQNSVSAYRQAAVNPGIAPIQRDQISAQIENKIADINAKVAKAGSSLDSATVRNSKVRKDLQQFEKRDWYKQPN